VLGAAAAEEAKTAAAAADNDAAGILEGPNTETSVGTAALVPMDVDAVGGTNVEESDPVT